MKKVAILTDSNGGMTAQEARDLGVTVLPMPVYIDKKLYFEGVDLSQERFFELLPGASEVRTSQPSPATVTDLWDELLKTHDEVVHIPMSSGLSGSCDSAKMLAREYGGRVEVVDNHRISVTMRRSVFDAVKLKGEGMTAAEIKKRLEETAAVSAVSAVVSAAAARTKHAPQYKTRIADSGRQAGRLLQSSRQSRRSRRDDKGD